MMNLIKLNHYPKMITRILAGGSVLTLALAVPAIAQTANNPADHNRGPVITKDDIKQGWEDTKDSIKKTTEDISKAIDNTYDDIKAVIIDEDHKDNRFHHANYNTANTAKNIIGRDVHDVNGKVIAKIHDIIIDDDGDAKMAILSDGGFFGIGGKLIALDYDKVFTSTDRAEMLNPLSEAMIKDVQEFSYTPGGTKIRTLPADSISLRDALKGDLVDMQNKKLASITDIFIEDGDAEYLLVTFDQTLGLGGDIAALELDDATALRKDGKVDFQLSSKQEAAFNRYKASVQK